MMLVIMVMLVESHSSDGGSAMNHCIQVPTELLKSQSEAAACRCYVMHNRLSSRTPTVPHWLAVLIFQWFFMPLLILVQCKSTTAGHSGRPQAFHGIPRPHSYSLARTHLLHDAAARRSTQRAPDVEVSETTVTFQWNSGDEPDEPWILWVSHMISVDFRFQWGFMTVVNKRSLCRFTGELTTVWCLLLLLSRLDQISSCKLTSMFKASCAEREPRKNSAMAATQFLTTTRSSILASTKSFQRLLNVTW